MKSLVLLVAPILFLTGIAHAENRFDISGVDIGPQLVTPITDISLDIPDSRLRARLYGPIVERLHQAGVATSSGRQVAHISFQSTSAAAPLTATAVLVSLRVTEPVRVWPGGTRATEYIEFVVWLRQSVLCLPPISQEFSQVQYDATLARVAQDLLTSFLHAVKGAVPPAPTISIPGCSTETPAVPDA